jgi:hypothetical protein
VSGTRRLFLSVIALTMLLVVVAVASRAHKPGSGSGAATGHVPRTLFEYLASVMIVLLPLGGIVILFALAQSRRQKVLAGERNWRRSLAMVLVMTPLFIAAFFLVRHFRSQLYRPSVAIPPPAATTTPTTLPSTGTTTGLATPPQEAQFQWLPVLVLASLALGVAAVIAFALYRKRLHGEQWDEEAAFLTALDEVLADTLDDLRAERDPRKAVIRTYARMEKTFAAFGVPRDESEAPLEYVARVLDRLQVSSYSVRRVTDLFARAKFSPHEIDAGMKDEAIEALAGLRAELVHEEPEAA